MSTNMRGLLCEGVMIWVPSPPPPHTHTHTGCTDMKRFMFISAGVLPERTFQHEWVDLKYLETGVFYSVFFNFF